MAYTESSAYPSVLTNSMVFPSWNGTNNTICVSVENPPKAGWVWFHDRPLLHGSLQVLMLQVILFNAVYLAVYFALRPFKQTKFVSSVLAGIILRHIMGHKRGMETLFPVEGIILMKTLGFLGMTLFIFLMAVKMDITMIRRTAKKATIVGLFSLLLPFLCVLLFVLTASEFPAGQMKLFRYLFAAGLAVTRLANTAYAFDEMNLLTSKLGQLVMSSTMLDEIFTWFVLIFGTYIRQVNGKGTRSSLAILLHIVALVMFTAFMIRPILVLMVKRTPQGKPVKRIFILGVFLLALLMAFLTDMIGSTHMGVLILGLAIPPGPPLGSELVRMSEVFVMNYLMPLFYITVGYNVKISAIFDIDTYDYNVKIFIISVALASVTKFIGAAFGALFSKLSGEQAILVGLMMNLKGPMDLFLFIRWSSRKEFTDKSYTILVLSHVILTSIVTALIDRLYSSYESKIASYGTLKSMREMQTNPSSGEMRILCCVHHDQDISIFLPLLKATNPTVKSTTSAYVAHLNSLEGRAIPLVSHDDRKIRRVHSNRSDRIAYAFEKHAADSNGLVTTKIYTMIAPYKSMHHNICSLAQEESIALIVSPFHNNYASIDINEMGGVRIFNNNLQNYAACTVGILVDRGMSQFTSSDHGFCCNVGVVFIGGADDREAVTFATRMLGNPSLNMTLVRLQVTNYYYNNNKPKAKHDSDIEEKIEKKLDEAVIHDFWAKSGNNTNCVYREIPVEDIEQALDGIRTLGTSQNLILVGRQRHVAKSIFDEAMLEWSDNPELGAIGDFVASADFQDGKTSVLVMQRYNISEGGSHHSLHVTDPIVLT